MSRNIVLVTYDSLRADHCSFMGYERETTPNMDVMADDGLVFENAVASGVPTVASMTSVMTGEHSLASPELGNAATQREQITTRPKIAEVLSDAGYSTGALVPNPPASSYFGFDEGFDWFEDFLAEERGVFERAWNRVFQRSMSGGPVATYLRLARNMVQREEVLRPWEDFYEEILQWRESVSEPYFLWVLLLEPHHPWVPPSDTQQWSSRLGKYRAFQHYWEMFNSGWEPDFDTSVQRRLVNLYDDSIRYGDEFLKRIREDLAGDDPAFVVHADHGEEFGGHGRYGHQPYLTEDLVHVPLFVNGIDETRTVEHPVALRQIAPTIAEIADVSHPFQASSLLDEPTRPWVTSKVFAEQERRLALRTNCEKYLKTGDNIALYEINTDREEENNLAAGNPDAVNAFESAAKKHVQRELEKRAIRDTTAELATEGSL